ncbi:MAG: P1 family peptidase [Pseudomonadota bacterium]
MEPSPLNLITDVPGIEVGNAEDLHLQTGVTVVTGPGRMIAGAHVMGGAPGTRETELLSPEMVVNGVDALVLSGGSAFGLGAADGVSQGLRDAGAGLVVHGHTIPIVPTAIVFDLTTGAQDWRDPPWRNLGAQALANRSRHFELGSRGAGTGATTADLKGGLGSASAMIDQITVGAVVVVNAIGSVVAGGGPHFWAAPFEENGEFGGLGVAAAGRDWTATKTEQAMGATLIAVVATDMVLSKAQAKRLAIMSHDGIARAVVPSHTPFDGDIVFAASTGAIDVPDSDVALIRVGHTAATCLARAIARAVYSATPAKGDPKPTWRARFG